MALCSFAVVVLGLGFFFVVCLFICLFLKWLEGMGQMGSGFYLLWENDNLTVKFGR